MSVLIDKWWKREFWRWVQCQSQHNIVTHKLPCIYVLPYSSQWSSHWRCSHSSVTYYCECLMATTSSFGPKWCYHCIPSCTGGHKRWIKKNVFCWWQHSNTAVSRYASDAEICSTMFYMLFFFLSGLNEYTTYSASVAANNSLGIGPYSQPVEVMNHESSKSRILLFLFT